jgi:type IV secretory pathway VirB2 component (pilin)
VRLRGAEDRVRRGRRLTASLSDPAGASVIVAAASWLQGTLLGSIATTVAVIAVSWVGMLMLAGRLEIRRGLTAIAGCFILFGATSIAAGIRGALGSGGTEIAAAPPPPVAPPVQPPPMPRNADPYAGASATGR